MLRLIGAGLLLVSVTSFGYHASHRQEGAKPVKIRRAFDPYPKPHPTIPDVRTPLVRRLPDQVHVPSSEPSDG
jgi:hypothetical protein